MTNLLYYAVGDGNPPSFDELEYVAVSEHPDDVVPISNGDYNQLWSLFHYENFVLGKTGAPGSNNIICARTTKNSSSSSGVLNNSQPKELCEKGASSSGTLSDNELDYYNIDYPNADADADDAANTDTDDDDTCDDADEDGMDPQPRPQPDVYDYNNDPEQQLDEQDPDVAVITENPARWWSWATIAHHRRKYRMKRLNKIWTINFNS